MGLPFLLLSEDPLVEEVQSRWDFLSVFGVVTEPTPEFFVGIYDQIVGKISLDDAASEFQALYSMLSKKPSHDRLAFFNARKEIYVPSGKTGHAKLVPLQHCLWNGPCWLQASYVLSYVKGYCENPQIQTMLRVILNPTEAGLETYIKELRYQQGIGMASFPHIERIYAHLSEDSMDEADLTTMRDLFKRHKLVYHPDSLKWYSPPECAWALSSDDSRISIGQYYPQFRELFMARLLIGDSMTRLYISKLSEIVGRRASSLDELLSVMQKFDDLPLSLSDIGLLNRIKFLPIVGVSQVQYYSSPRDEFFIVDRDGWPSNFRGIVPTLRFRVDQVQRIRSFLIRVGLENRFITVAGLKQTFVSQERIKGLPQLTCDFQDRAAALCRCATFYASENAMQQQELYDLFRASLIYESRDIIARCTIPTADGATKSIDTPDMLHVQYESGELQLVVPNDITQRQICFATQLPEALASLFSANSPEARGTFATILREPIDNLDSILDSYGIPELSEVFVDAEESVESETSMEEVDETLSISDSSLTEELIDLVDHMDLDTDPEDSVEPEV
ncbi:uncharacterized protein LDX57_008744 [Aspergillus melleus]|uniref:uncharacterized protein n=1 Tax=Aspergillus melleus TaxID=138277 RepID=UPI001E8C9E45|nr:uncharacterized protein LDX57_008744 [Aspergillus melleus]KAH8431083.1 hypothetical protein LDX57_008744 [Aspergillus melleus]